MGDDMAFRISPAGRRKTCPNNVERTSRLASRVLAYTAPHGPADRVNPDTNRRVCLTYKQTAVMECV